MDKHTDIDISFKIIELKNIKKINPSMLRVIMFYSGMKLSGLQFHQAPVEACGNGTVIF